MRSATILLAFAASVAASPAGHLFERAACNADNCLRALRNTARPGLADCSSYLRATVTPATSTSYTTLTFSTTPTLTYQVTDTVTNLTATEVVTKYVTVTTGGQTIKKRQVTVIPTNIPTYASACSGRVRYTSACTCLGASATTTTLATPTTVVTVSRTITPATAVQYINVQTEQLTLTDATVTTTTVVATITVTEDVPVATVTPAARFHIRANSEQVPGQYLRLGGSESWANTYLQHHAQKHQTEGVFTLAENGDLLLVTGDRTLFYPWQSGDTQAVWIVQSGTPTGQGRRVSCCLDDDTKRLYCQNPAEPGADLVSCEGQVAPLVVWYNGAGELQSNCERLELTAELI